MGGGLVPTSATLSSSWGSVEKRGALMGLELRWVLKPRSVLSWIHVAERI